MEILWKLPWFLPFIAIAYGCNSNADCPLLYKCERNVLSFIFGGTCECIYDTQSAMYTLCVVTSPDSAAVQENRRKKIIFISCVVAVSALIVTFCLCCCRCCMKKPTYNFTVISPPGAERSHI